jgi:two-component system, NarL family, response regulator LiaR
MTQESATIPALRILLVDDHVIVRQGLHILLSSRADMTIVGEASNGIEAVQLAQSLQPDVILMDVVLPGMDGIAAVRRIRELGVPCAILMLTSSVQPHQIQAAIRAGAVGYVLKATHAQALVHAIQRASRGQRTLDPLAADALMDGMAQGDGLDELTPREQEILRALARGLNNAAIGEQLFITEATVRSHTASLLAKLGLRDRTQAMVFALKRGLIELDDII